MWQRTSAWLLHWTSALWCRFTAPGKKPHWPSSDTSIPPVHVDFNNIVCFLNRFCARKTQKVGLERWDSKPEKRLTRPTSFMFRSMMGRERAEGILSSRENTWKWKKSAKQKREGSEMWKENIKKIPVLRWSDWTQCFSQLQSWLQ